MPDLPVVAVLSAKTGSEAALGQALALLGTASRDEAGCLSYEVYESQAAPGTFVTVESWTDQAALDAHFQTPHLQAALATATDLLAGDPAIHPLTSLR